MKKINATSTSSRFSAEIICLLFFLLVGLYALVFPINWAALFEFEAFTFPKWIAALLTLSSTLWLINYFRSASAKINAIDSKDLLRTFIFISMIVVYAILLDILSYYIATSLFAVVGLIYLSGIRVWKSAILLCAGWLLFVYLLFEKLFSVVLPGP